MATMEEYESSLVNELNNLNKEELINLIKETRVKFKELSQKWKFIDNH